MVGQVRSAPCRTRRTDVRCALIAALTSCVALRCGAWRRTPEERWRTEARAAGSPPAQRNRLALPSPRAGQPEARAQPAAYARAGRPAPWRSSRPGTCTYAPRAVKLDHRRGPRATPTVSGRRPPPASACPARLAHGRRARRATAAQHRASGTGKIAPDSRRQWQKQPRSAGQRGISKDRYACPEPNAGRRNEQVRAPRRRALERRQRGAFSIFRA